MFQNPTKTEQKLIIYGSEQFIMNIYKTFGLKEVINADGKMTALGGSATSNVVAKNMATALENFVIMEDLLNYTGQVIAKYTISEDGCPTVGAAAGIAISTASVITGKNLSLVQSVPHHGLSKCEIVIQKGHCVDFGGNITQMIQLGGGKVVEVGTSNNTEIAHIEEAINENTAALFYIKSHHCVQKGMQPIETLLDLGRKYNIPVIIDAAAEEDLQRYYIMGADLIIYSGSKALNGPTCGFICGKKDLIANCKLQYKGIGRAMKVSKEAMIGLITSLDMYGKETPNNFKYQMQVLATKLEQETGLECQVAKDEVRDFYRCQIKLKPKTAYKLNEALKQGDPAIFLRPYYINQGILFVDPRGLKPGQEDIIVESIKKLVGSI